MCSLYDLQTQCSDDRSAGVFTVWATRRVMGKAGSFLLLRCFRIPTSETTLLRLLFQVVNVSNKREHERRKGEGYGE